MLFECGQSAYGEVLSSIGYPEETASAVVEMFAEAFVKKSKTSLSSPSFEELNWEKQFDTGKSPSKENPENYHTGTPKKPGRGQLPISKTGVKGDLGKREVNSDSSAIVGAALEKGPGNPMAGSSKDVQGMRMLG